TVVLLCLWPVRWITSEWNAGHAMSYIKHPKLETEYYQKADNWDQENFRAVFGMGQVTYKQKNYKESARYFTEFESFYPYNPPALNMLGAAFMMSGQYQQAEGALQRALNIYPDFDMAKQNLTRIQMILRQQRHQQQPSP
ncbi:MAG: tetratricopeptide repeat protein, partial [Ghiorsea sp.]